MKLIPITYHNKKYLLNIKSEIDEVAGHLDKTQISPSRKYSLHTEYSHMKRNLSSEILNKYPLLKNSHKNYVPQLWKNKEWAIEFANFIIDLISTNIAPEIIEIHPPFNDYCTNFKDFLDIYENFEKIILEHYPNTLIYIENRCGTFYKGGNFLLSTKESIIDFLKELGKRNYKLKMVLDYPQIFSAEKIKLDNIKLDTIKAFNNSIKKYKKYIGGFHMWGKRKNSTDTRWTPHTGNLNTFFSNNDEQKKEFLYSILNTFDDEEERHFVPEVNSGEEDLQSIVTDMMNCGFIFPIEKTIENTTPYRQIQSLEWINNKPFLNIYDSTNETSELIACLRLKTIIKGKNKRCIGYKNLKNIKHNFCEKHNIINHEDKQCLYCKNLDKFSYCVMCKGNNCRNKSEEALEYCNQTHYVYLVYFSKDKIKVGTCHSKRKFDRLCEQGAPIALLIAKVPNGQTARIIEHKIVEMGYSETVTSKYKIDNIIMDNTRENIVNLLNKELDSIKKNINNELKSYFIEPEIYDDLNKFEFIKQELKSKVIIQQSLFNDNEYFYEIEKLPNPFINNKTIISVIGTIAILKDNDKYYYINIKDILGWEILKIE